MPEQDIKIVLKAVDKTSAELRKVNDSLKNLGKTVSVTTENNIQATQSMGDMTKSVFLGVGGWNLLAGGVSRVFSGMKDFTKESVTTALNVERLQATIYRLGQNTGYAKEQVDGIISSIREKNKSMEDALAITQGVILAGLQETDAVKLLTAAREIGAATGKSSSEVNRLLLDSMMQMTPQMMKEVGITFSLKEAKEDYAISINKSVKELTTAEIKQAIFNRLMIEAEKFQGSYNEAMKTGAKLLSSNKDALGDVYLVMGKLLTDAMAPMLQDTLNQIRAFRQWALTSEGELNPALEGVRKEIGEVGYAFVSLGFAGGEAILGLHHAFQSMMDVIWTIGENIATELGRWWRNAKEVAKAIGLAFGAIALAMKFQFKEAIDVLSSITIEWERRSVYLFDNVGKAGEKSAVKMTESFQRSWEALKRGFYEVRGEAEKVGKEIPEEIEKMGDAIADTMETSLEKVADATVNTIDKVKEKVSDFRYDLEEIPEELSNIWDKFSEKSISAWENLEERVTGIKKDIAGLDEQYNKKREDGEEDFQGQMLKLYNDHFKKRTKLMKEKELLIERYNERYSKSDARRISDIYDDIAKETKILEDFSQYRVGLNEFKEKSDMQALSEKHQKEMTELKEQNEKRKKEFMDRLDVEKEEYAKHHLELVADTKELFIDLSKEYGKGFDNLIRDLERENLPQLRSIIEEVTALKEKVTREIAVEEKREAEYEPGVFRGGLIREAAGYAKGGIVTRPTLAMVGEKGPEAIIPLNKANTSNITININNPVVRKDSDIRSIAKQVSDVLTRRRELKLIGAL